MMVKLIGSLLNLAYLVGKSLKNRIPDFKLAAPNVLVAILPQFLQYVKFSSKSTLSLKRTTLKAYENYLILCKKVWRIGWKNLYWPQETF